MKVKTLLISGIILLTPFFFVLAQGGLVPCNGPECQACHVVKLAQNIINFLVTVSVFIAVLLFAWAGMIMVTAGGSTEAISKARGMFTSVAIGFIVVLAAWLIVDTIMRLLTNQAALGPWNEIKCESLPTVPGTGTQPGGVGTGQPSASGTLSDADARARLAAAGIGVWSSGNCSNQSQSNCTSLEGIRESTINDAIALKQSCGCDVTITGGTEGGVHAGGTYSHGAGYKYDAALNPTLNNYITSNYTYVGQRGDGAAMYQNPNTGVLYAREGNHWDVQVK